MGIDQATFPFRLIREQLHDAGPATAIETLYKECGFGPRVIYLEGIDLWVPDSSDRKRVSTIVRDIRRAAEHFDLSVICSSGTTKSKPKEQYKSVRERIVGTGAWGRVCSTVVEIQVDEDDPQQARVVTTASRTAGQQQMRMIINGRTGRLEETRPQDVVLEEGEEMSKNEQRRLAIFHYLDNSAEPTPENLEKELFLGPSTARR